MKDNLKKRIIIAFTFGPLIILLLWLGGYFWLAFLAILVALLLFEYLKLTSLENPSQKILLFIFSTIVFYLFIRSNYEILLGFFVLFFIIEAIYILLKENLETGYKRFLSAVVGIVYVVIMPLYSYKIRHLFVSETRCRVLAMFPVFLMWLVDTVAYFYGCAYGKRRLMEKISPNKTVEGFVAGVISGGVFGFVYHLIFKKYVGVGLVPIAFFGAIVGEFGDLFESMLKRNAGVKDSSNIIPGHGGVLDRFDSFIFVQPFFYLFYRLLFME